MVFLAEVDGQCDCSCGAPPDLLIKHGWTAGRTVLDCNLRYKRTIIYFVTQRYKCQICQKITQSVNQGLHTKHRLTDRLVEYIRKKSLSLYKTFAEISLDTGVHEKIVRDIFSDYSVELERTRILSAPVWIAIDEVYPSGRKYPLCVITDPLQKKIIGLLPDKKPETLRKWLLQLPNRSRVKVVSIDMYEGYKSAVTRMLPDALIVADRYHVHNQLNTALKDVLAIIRETLTKNEQVQYMRPDYLILSSRFNLSAERVRGSELSEKECAENWLSNIPDLSKAYKLKEKFSDILDSNDRETADDKAKVWLEEVIEYSKYFVAKYAKHCLKFQKYPFRSVIRTFKSWINQILNYINFKWEYEIKVSNAFAENVNRVIKAAYTSSNGCNFEVLRSKVLNGDFIKKQLTPNPLKNKRKKRGKRSVQTGSRISVDLLSRSNIVRMREAREGNDKTKGYILDPKTIASWMIRFRHHIESWPQIIEKPPTCGLFSGTKVLPSPVKKPESKFFTGKKKTKSRSQNPEQPSLI